MTTILTSITSYLKSKKESYKVYAQNEQFINDSLKQGYDIKTIQDCIYKTKEFEAFKIDKPIDLLQYESLIEDIFKPYVIKQFEKRNITLSDMEYNLISKGMYMDYLQAGLIDDLNCLLCEDFS